MGSQELEAQKTPECENASHRRLRRAVWNEDEHSCQEDTPATLDHLVVVEFRTYKCKAANERKRGFTVGMGLARLDQRTGLRFLGVPGIHIPRVNTRHYQVLLEGRSREIGMMLPRMAARARAWRQIKYTGYAVRSQQQRHPTDQVSHPPIVSGGARESGVP